MSFAADLAQARFDAGLTYEDAAAYLTANRVRAAARTVRAWEKGDNEPSEVKQRAVLRLLAAHPNASGPDDDDGPITALDAPERPARPHDADAPGGRGNGARHPDGSREAWFYVTLSNGSRRYYAPSAFRLVASAGPPPEAGVVAAVPPAEATLSVESGG